MKEGWTYKKLGEVATFINGDRSTNYPSKKDYVVEGVPFVNAGNLIKDGLDITSLNLISQNKYDSLTQGKFVEGDILFCLRGTLGKHSIVQNGLKGAIASSLVIIRSKEGFCNKFISYYLDYNQPIIESMNNGAAQPNIPAKTMKGFSIMLPTDEKKQQEIVTYLDESFAEIDLIKAEAEKQLSDAKALFQKALSQAMTPKEGWEKKKLGEVCDIFGRIGFRGYTTKDLVKSSSEGAISLSPSNIQDGKMDYSKCTYISWFKYEESPEIKIYNGDILLVKTGSSYGKSALVENLPHEATINPQSVVLKNCNINTKYFAYYLRTTDVLKEFDKFVSGTAIPTFSQAKLSTVPIKHPSPSDQQRIVEELDELSENVKEIEALNNKLTAECDAMKQALLRQVFE